MPIKKVSEKMKEKKLTDQIINLRKEIKDVKAQNSLYLGLVEDHRKEILSLAAQIRAIKEQTPEGRIAILEAAIKKAISMHLLDPDKHDVLMDALNPPVHGKAG